MSKESFVKFYEEFLSQNESVRDKLESAHQQVFAKTALELGKQNGFDFNEDDIKNVMGLVSKKLVSVEVMGHDDMTRRVTYMCCW